MKKNIKIIIMCIILIIFGIYSSVYAETEYERIVDIPVPPNSSGKADFTSEEGEQQAKQYEEEKKNEEINENQSTNSTEEYTSKSSDNYLKNLIVENYSLDPKFDMLKNEYTIYLPNRENIETLSIIAETNNNKAKVDGAGTVQIQKEQKIININVIAENGNLNVYTIKLEDLKDKPQVSRNDSYVLIGTIIIVAIIFIIALKTKRKK